jgi:alpha-beta hydrolase superfamily lysophospholipase
VSAQGHRIFVRVWRGDSAKATVIIAHGMGEHSERYDTAAHEFASAGFAVVAADHRGHGYSMVEGRAGDMGYDGWTETIRDLHRVSVWARNEIGDLPQMLLGHSMGAMLAQQYIYLFGHDLRGCVLSGSPGFLPTPTTVAGELFASFEAWRSDPAQHSAVLQRLLFASNNKAWDGDASTGFEWLSRDEEEVQKYVDDPFCGFVLATGSAQGMFHGARRAADHANVATIPKTLPIYVISGGEDPLHNDLKQLGKLTDCYSNHGLSVERRIYEGARHELFHETNRDDVVADCLSWLEERTR